MLIFEALVIHELYMQRCLQLAQLGAGNTAPNPMVGAVLLHNNVIIGEGYHHQYGEAHAEVNCINSVSIENRPLIEKSILYVSLEPCAHFGKTPPCADLIISQKIPTVVIGCTDSYAEVSGKGIEKLKASGVKVITGVLEKKARYLNRRFFTFFEKHRPYIILKWAQSGNAQIANADFSTVKISNEFTNRLVHKWRNEEAAIMVGTNTALYDNPSLTNRYWHGNSPVRIVIDKDLKLPLGHHVFSGETKTIVFNLLKEENAGNVIFKRIAAEKTIPSILKQLYEMKIQSVLIEGGTKLLQSFIDGGVWDEARVITNQTMIIENGIAAPVLRNSTTQHTETFFSDSIQYFTANNE